MYARSADTFLCTEMLLSQYLKLVRYRSCSLAASDNSASSMA